MPARQVLRVFIIILAPPPAPAALAPTGACPLHAAGILRAASSSPLLARGELHQRRARREAAQGDDGVRAEVWDGEGEVGECQCCSLERFEGVEELFG